jgi:imidazolonepropionase-like amidohydrolase
MVTRCPSRVSWSAPAAKSYAPLALFLLALVAGRPTEAHAASPSAAPPLAIEHVTVLSMTPQSRPLHDVTVVIREGRIAAITPSAQAGKLFGLKRLNGSGKWLMPGLTDMHVHLDNEGFRRLPAPTPEAPMGARRRDESTPYTLPDDVFTPYLFNGVLQVFDLQAMSESLAQRLEVESGRVLGPHIILAAMIDGSPPSWPIGSTRVATTPDNGRQAVRDAAAEGYDMIKVYSRLDLDTFTAIVDEAKKLNMRVVGHIPQRGKGLTGKFFQPGFDMVAHAEEFAQQTTPPAIQSIPQYVEMARLNGTWLTATLTVDERILEQLRDPDSLKRRLELRFLNPGKYEVVLHHNPYIEKNGPAFLKYVSDIVAFNRELMRAFLVAQIPIVAGTDAGIPGIVPGFSLHDELELLAGAGMTNLQVLESATRLPSEWLRVADDRGTVEPGKRADLLLLDADPLENVSNTRRIAAVVLRGRYLSRSMLDRRLKDLDAHYSAMRATMEKARTRGVGGVGRQ